MLKELLKVLPPILNPRSSRSQGGTRLTHSAQRAWLNKQEFSNKSPFFKSILLLRNEAVAALIQTHLNLKGPWPFWLVQRFVWEGGCSLGSPLCPPSGWVLGEGAVLLPAALVCRWADPEDTFLLGPRPFLPGGGPAALRL